MRKILICLAVLPVAACNIQQTVEDEVRNAVRNEVSTRTQDVENTVRNATDLDERARNILQEPDVITNRLNPTANEMESYISESENRFNEFRNAARGQ